jgi:DNA-directed RNA polymerase subunit M/transcription elongation factor TFIIS
MIAIKGRRRCSNCGKRYNYYYASNPESKKEIKYKGKDGNASQCTNVKILSNNSFEVTVNCPECGFEEVFVYTD